jgi:hypothetical protein
LNLKIKHTDNKGFFGEGYYDATIVKIEPYRTAYGPRLMIWFSIKNQHEREMKVNEFVTTDCTSGNLLGKIYKIIFPGKILDDFDSDDLINKQIGIVLHKRIKKGKSYLNIGNFLPLKVDELPSVRTKHQDHDELAKQLAILIKKDPTFARALMEHSKQIPKKTGKESKPHGAKKLKDIIKEDLNNRK